MITSTFNTYTHTYTDLPVTTRKGHKPTTLKGMDGTNAGNKDYALQQRPWILPSSKTRTENY